MNNLQQNQILTLDSREVAEMLEISHWEILRKLEGTEKVKGIIPVLAGNKIVVSKYFIKSSYKDESGKTNKCYLFTKMGCEFIANKFTGEKGILFTAAYTERFNQMENKLKEESIVNQLSPQLQMFKQIFESVAQQELRQKEIEQKVKIVNHRINSLDCTNIQGTPQQRLNSMVKKYAFDNGITFGRAWDEFKAKFNTAYHTNVTEKKNNYLKAKGIKSLTVPEYLSKVGMIEDALRVADKMLNQGGNTANGQTFN